MMASASNALKELTSLTLLLLRPAARLVPQMQNALEGVSFLLRLATGAPLSPLSPSTSATFLPPALAPLRKTSILRAIAIKVIEASYVLSVRLASRETPTSSAQNVLSCGKTF